MRFSTRSLLTLIAATAGGSAALAAPSSTQIAIHGVVPTICRVQFANPVVQPEAGVLNLGNMSEFCNQGEGYRVVVRHPAGLQQAQFTVDGVAVPLSSGTETVLIDSNGPRVRNSQVLLTLGGSPVQLASLSFSAEPKGITY